MWSMRWLRATLFKKPACCTYRVCVPVLSDVGIAQTKRFNFYCSSANGMAGHFREIAVRTEQY